MCGITGLWLKSSDGTLDQTIATMTTAITHRGPDSEGLWSDTAANLRLGHRRLAILDLSPQGKQPMLDGSGRYVVVFNGEIYNHLRIRQELEALAPRSWRGTSDTETLLEGVSQWGLEGTLKRAEGMFALALWDKQERSLSLARDRAGEKPLYYFASPQGLYFASELTSFQVAKLPGLSVNRGAIELLLRFKYIPGPHSIYENVFKLPPGTIRKFTEPTKSTDKAYWDVTEVALSGTQKPFHGSFEEATDTLEAQLTEVVRSQMLSDVPLGAFLSGGIDSSLISALMQKQSSRPIKTFTIGFNDKKYDEAIYAKEVAKHLKTDHHEVYFSSENVRSIVPKLPEIYSEPFADRSQLPTYLLAQTTRQHVTVALSGDAGDELFGGYRRYQVTAPLWDKQTKLSGLEIGLKKALLSAGAVFDRSKKDSLQLLSCADFPTFYQKKMSRWWLRSELVLSKDFLNLDAWTDRAQLRQLNTQQQMMLLDQLTYLPEYILTKVDRATMANSLETRAPFLNHKVIEFAWTLPTKYKLDGKIGKKVLREVLYRHVPRELIERPKHGFDAPVPQWLRSELKEWAGDLLSPSRVKREGYLDNERLQKLWADHQKGHDRSEQLWSVLMFQAWLEHTNRMKA